MRSKGAPRKFEVNRKLTETLDHNIRQAESLVIKILRVPQNFSLWVVWVFARGKIFIYIKSAAKKPRKFFQKHTRLF